MAKKRLNTSAIANELQHSPFFAPVTSVAPVVPVAQTSSAPATIAPSPAAAPPVSAQPVVVSPGSQTPTSAPSAPSVVTSPVPSVEPSPEPSTERSLERPIHPPKNPPIERSVVRTKVRHTFDIWADQLFSLKELAMERERLTGSRVLLGDLVQEALDGFLTHERHRGTQRTNDRPTE